MAAPIECEVEPCEWLVVIGKYKVKIDVIGKNQNGIYDTYSSIIPANTSDAMLEARIVGLKDRPITLGDWDELRLARADIKVNVSRRLDRFHSELLAKGEFLSINQIALEVVFNSPGFVLVTIDARFENEDAPHHVEKYFQVESPN